MTKLELIHRIAHKQPQLVERDVTLSVRVMFEQMAARLAGGGRIEIGPCVREERSTDIRRCKSPIRNWGRAKAGVLSARRPRESGRTVPAGHRPRSASAFADLQSTARGNRRM